MEKLVTLLAALTLLLVSSEVHAQCSRIVQFSVAFTTPDGKCNCVRTGGRSADCDGAPTPPVDDANFTCVQAFSCNPTDPVHAEACADKVAAQPATGCEGATCSCEDGCNGADEDTDGQVDEGSCTPDGPCSNTRTDPVHVANGGYMSHPIVDYRHHGAPIDLEFVRSYTSHSGWPDSGGADLSLGRGWFHTYNERLLSDSYTGVGTLPDVVIPWVGTLTVVHRNGRGRGRAFECASPNPTTDFSCTSSDGSLDTLDWDVSENHWVLRTASGPTDTFFSKKGELLEHRNLEGFGWEVTYYTSGDFDGLIEYVEDDFNRRLTFVYDDQRHLIELENAASEVVAEFARDDNGRLTSVESTALTEYTYLDFSYLGFTISTQLITDVVVDGDTLTSVSYETDFTSDNYGRVLDVVAADGDFAFRYVPDSPSVCANPDESVLIVDRAADSGPSCASATGDPDVWCTTQIGEIAVCDTGDVCQPATCQEYRVVSSEVDTQHPAAIEGNCPCGGSDEMHWTDTTQGTRLSWKEDRDGLITSYAYDTSARLVAVCVGDTLEMSGEPEVTTSESSCPATGQWKGYTYDTNWPGLVASVSERSRLQNGQLHVIDYTYDATTGLLEEIDETGYTNDISGGYVSRALTQTFTYDTYGRMTQWTGAHGEVTDYTYFAPGSTNTSGMVDEIERTVGTTSLITDYNTYDETGLPLTWDAEDGTSVEHQYDTHGRVTRRKVEGTTQYEASYNELGLMATEWDNIRGEYRTFHYDSNGRLEETRTYDKNGGSGDYELSRVEYDSAGRVTGRYVERSISSTVTTYSETHATYDERGFVDALEAVPNLPSNYTRDVMGRVTEIEYGDGETEDFAYDALGRQDTYTQNFSGTSSGDYSSSFSTAAGDTSPDSLPTTLTDPEGYTRSYEYDDFGRLIESSSDDFGDNEWEYEYTGGDNVVLHLLPSGNESIYTYDDIGRIESIDHDAANPSNVGQDYEYIYGDQTSTCNITGSSCSYRDGRLARVDIEIDSTTTWSLEYDYDELGRVTVERWPDENETEYDYGLGSRVDEMTFPVPTGYSIAYGYDATANNGIPNNEHTSAELRLGLVNFTVIDDIERDPFGRLTLADLVNPNAQVTRSYRLDGQPTTWGVERGTGSNAVNRTYQYEDDGECPVPC